MISTKRQLSYDSHATVRDVTQFKVGRNFWHRIGQMLNQTAAHTEQAAVWWLLMEMIHDK